jgi:hypothetical protein
MLASLDAAKEVEPFGTELGPKAVHKLAPGLKINNRIFMKIYANFIDKI